MLKIYLPWAISAHSEAGCRHRQRKIPADSIDKYITISILSIASCANADTLQPFKLLFTEM